MRPQAKRGAGLALAWAHTGEARRAARTSLHKPDCAPDCALLCAAAAKQQRRAGPGRERRRGHLLAGDTYAAGRGDVEEGPPVARHVLAVAAHELDPRRLVPHQRRVVSRAHHLRPRPVPHLRRAQCGAASSGDAACGVSPSSGTACQVSRRVGVPGFSCRETPHAPAQPTPHAPAQPATRVAAAQPALQACAGLVCRGERGEALDPGRGQAKEGLPGRGPKERS